MSYRKYGYYSTYIHQVHIVDGFADDCDELIHRCCKFDVLTFQTFTEIWKDMNFATIYAERTSGAEIAEVSEEVIHIAKNYMVADTSNYEESVAGLFLVYALINLQPFSNFASLRLTPEDVTSVNRIEVVARRERRLDVLYTLGWVLVKGTHYHAESRERGMEASLRKYLEGFTSIDNMGIRPKGVLYRQNEEMDLIREINNVSRRYSDSKAALATVKGEKDRSLNYCDHNLSQELTTSLKKMINGIINDDEESEQPEHYDSVQAIKSKAMKETVNPMKHLSGVVERKKLSPRKEKTQKIETKTTHENIKPVSPRASSSPRKRTVTQNKTKAKRRKQLQRHTFIDSDSDDEILELSDTDNEEEDVIEKDEGKIEIEIDMNASRSQEPNNSNEPVDEQEIEIEIESLPVLIRTDNNEDSIEIEVIDNYKDRKKQETKKENIKKKILAMPDVSIKKVKRGAEVNGNPELTPITDMAQISKILTRDDYLFKIPSIPADHVPTLRKPEKRDQKKPILKSKFKRMGMLPVANFEDGTNNKK